MLKAMRHTAVLSLGYTMLALALAACGGAPESTTRTPLQDAAAPLRQLALELVNERRRHLGLGDLGLGDSVAAQLHAKQSLAALELLKVTAEGSLPETPYVASG